MRNVKNISLCVLLLALVSTAAGTTRYVPGDYSSIQDAIDAAATSGDEIEVAPGTYNEAINFNGKAIRLYSADGRDATTIDATGLGSSVVTCNSDEGADTMLDGFTIKGGGYVVNGGGMCNIGSSPTVKNCIFTSNRASRGGGMLNQNGNPTVTNCIFATNWGEYGGGMYNAYGSNSTVTNCTFEDNDAPWYGGGMLNGYDSNPTVTNCTFTSNWGNYGGGMANGLSNPTVTNCTFSNNYCTTIGNGMYNSTSNPTVTNCILWGYNPPQIANVDSTATVTYSDVQGGWTGTGNINEDPMFADADGRLLPASLCIDAGNDAAVPSGVTTDLDGNPRIQGLCVDMGAFEATPDPEMMLAQLKAYILQQVGLGTIDVDLEGGLLDKVDAASETLASGNPNSAKPAMNNMKALINQVEAQTGKKIEADTAAAIIVRANAIITALGG